MTMDRAAVDEAVHAHVCVAYFRALRLGVLRWLEIFRIPSCLRPDHASRRLRARAGRLGVR
jgi:hypothetical protein